MSIIARKLLIFLMAGAGLAAVPQVTASRSPAAPPPAVSELAPAAASCGPPPPVVARPSRPEDEGCSESPSPALARR
jgi:hypothetical protein